MMANESIGKFVDFCTTTDEVRNEVREKIAQSCQNVAELASTSGFDFTGEEFARFLRDSYIQPLVNESEDGQSNGLVELGSLCLSDGPADTAEGREFQTIEMGLGIGTLERLSDSSPSSEAVRPEAKEDARAEQDPKGLTEPSSEAAVELQPQEAASTPDVAGTPLQTDSEVEEIPTEDEEDWTPNQKPWWKFW